MKILKINTLEKGWADSDHLLLHASFQILVDFVEKESPFEIVDWSHNEAHINAAKEIRSLYRWWTKLRPARRDPLDDLKENEKPTWKECIEPIYSADGKTIDRHRFVSSHKKYPKYDVTLTKSFKLEQKWNAEDQSNLLRLVQIRSFLWV